MNNNHLLSIKENAFPVALFFLFLFFSCTGQEEKKGVPVQLKVEQFKIREDQISNRAEGLPEFKVDPHDKEYQGNQISGVVRTVFQDRKGNYWFGTQNGLCRKDVNGLVYFDLKDANGQKVTVYVILEDKEGTIWIGYGGGIAKYDGTYFTIFHQKDLLTPSGLWSMAIDKKGLLWIGTTQGVFTFDGTLLTSFELPEGKIDTSKGISTSKMIHSIMEDSKGNMWFGTNGGAFMYDGNKLRSIAEKNGLPSDFVNAILEDKKGTIWIATSRGLCSYNGIQLTNSTSDVLGENADTNSILQDKSGTIWFSSNKGRTIYSYQDEAFTKHQLADGNYSPAAFQIYEDKQERLWFVGFKGAYRYNAGTFVNVTRNGPW
jgi:ligand-binding sensor domain-containing protein